MAPMRVPNRRSRRSMNQARNHRGLPEVRDGFFIRGLWSQLSRTPSFRLSVAAALALLLVGVGKAPAAAPAREPLPAAYVAPMSHLDLTFMGTVEECLSRGGKVFAGALDLLERQPDFRFFIEYVMFLEAYRAMHPEQAAKLDKYIRAGRVELGAEWSGIYVAQEDEEDLVRNVLYAKAYARDRYKLELETLQLTDIPGVVPQLPQLCAGLGIRNLVLTRSAAPDTLFWYESPGGARVLTWSSKGYNQASAYGIHLDSAGTTQSRSTDGSPHPDPLPSQARGEGNPSPSRSCAPNGLPVLRAKNLSLSPQRGEGRGEGLRQLDGSALAAMRKRGLAERLADAAKRGVPPLFYYGSDQWLPPPNLAPTVRAWNAEASKQQQLAITTPTAYFRAIRAAGVADKAPVMRGELPSTWPYLEPAHAHVSRWDAVATRALDAAERLSTLAWLRAGRPYPRAELEQIWKSLLLARDHNYGGQGAGGGQARKFAERRNVQHRAQVLASQAMAALAERVEAPRESVPVVVFNTLNWDRSDVVHAHVSRYEAASGTQHDIFPRGSAMVLRGPDGQPVPFQITADRRGTLGECDFCFVARDVPALGYATYILEPEKAPPAPRGPQLWFEANSPEPAVVNTPELKLENGKMRLTIERATGLARINDVVT
ncbi:MAG: hypothetical protein FJ388_17220, partial [Verrucomicrobia bacterium]|nr:hypothetical protein [Verrucomicrobiota bacterium]